MKIETLLKIAGVLFTAGVGYGAASVSVNQKLHNVVTRDEFVAESVRVANNYERFMWEIKYELKNISALTGDNTSRLREICLQFKSGCR